MRTKFNLIIAIILLLPLPTFAQDNPSDLPPCTTPIAEIDGASTHLRNINDRVGNLREIFDDVQNGDIAGDELSYELMYWTVMADHSVVLNEGIVYPDCSEYVVLNAAFEKMIADMYAVATQATLVIQDRLNDYQADEVKAMLAEEITAVSMNIALWDTIYELAKAI